VVAHWLLFVRNNNNNNNNNNGKPTSPRSNTPTSSLSSLGKTEEEIAAEGTPAEVVPHKVMPGNRPSSTILAPKVTPSVLGQLVALYEHTVFVEGTIWEIDSFDQWGVELGKVMAKELAPILTSTSAPDLSGQDASTASLVRRYRGLRNRPV